MRLRLALALLIAATALPSTAHACSMAPGYKVPTNLELAAEAHTIVLATITGERRAKEIWDGVVLLKPTLLLKGATLPASVELHGALLATDEQTRQMVVASDPRELRAPNPGAMIGGCVRYIFAPGMQLVLFLKPDATGSLVPFRSAFSRDAEDVSGPDAPWVKAVREYAAASVLPRGEWKRRLSQRAAELRASSDADAQAIAADLDVERTGKRRPAYD